MIIFTFFENRASIIFYWRSEILRKCLRMIGLVAVLFWAIEAQCPSECKCILNTVRCYQAGLDQIPTEFPRNAELIDLRENNIQRIEKSSFGELPSLSVLLLSKNRIKYISPYAFTGMMNLGILFLNENELPNLDMNVFHNLKKLKKLFLYKNKLEKLDTHVFDAMVRLEVIRLDDNKLR